MYAQLKELPSTIQAALGRIGYNGKDIKLESATTYRLQDSGQDGRKSLKLSSH